MLIRWALLLLLTLLGPAEAKLGAEGCGVGCGSIVPQVTVIGLTASPNPLVATTTAGSGVSTGTVTAQVSSGALQSPVYTLLNDGGSGVVVVPTGGAAGNVQIGTGGAPAAGTYSLLIQVNGSNMLNTPPPQYTVSLVVSSTIAISGISASGCTVTAGSPQGTNICGMTPTSTGGALASPNIACAASGTSCISNEFQVAGTNPFQLQVGSAGVTAGSPVPSFDVTASNATNSPFTNVSVPVTVSAASISLVTPVNCTPTAPNCNGTVGDTTGTVLGLLVPTQVGSAGTISCSTTMPNSAGGKFQMTSDCHLQTGPTPYVASGSYPIIVAFSGSTATPTGPYNLSFTVTVNPSGSVTPVQQRVLTNFASGTSPATFWMPVGQPFADGQVPAAAICTASVTATSATLTVASCSTGALQASDPVTMLGVPNGTTISGACAAPPTTCTLSAPASTSQTNVTLYVRDGVLWKTGAGATFASQADDMIYWPDSSLRFGSFNLQAPVGYSLSSLQQDTIEAYDSPRAGFNNNGGCSSASITTGHDFRLEATLGTAVFAATANGTVLTVTGTIFGPFPSPTIQVGQPLFSFGVAIPSGITIQSLGTGTGGAGTYNLSGSVGTIGTSQVFASGRTTLTMSANAVFSGAPTRPILSRSGPLVCGYYIPDELRNGTTYASTPQGTAWAAMYVDVRSDGSYKVYGEVFPCRPLTPSGTPVVGNACKYPTTVPGILGNFTQAFVPDANGDAYSIKDYQKSPDPILMGCAAVISTTVGGCVVGGHATGAAFPGYAGFTYNTASSDGFPYDSQTDAHMLLPAYPLLVSSNPLTRGIYDAVMQFNIGYTSAMIGYAATEPPNPAAGPNVCIRVIGCDYAQTGGDSSIGLIDNAWGQCYLAGQATNGWTACVTSRLMGLAQGGSQDTLGRDETTGLQVNQTSATFSPTGNMRQNTTLFLCGTTISNLLCPNVPATENHQPDFAEGAWMMSGERWFSDGLRDQANMDIGEQNPGTRNIASLNSHSYSAICWIVDGSTRAMAWGWRDCENAYWNTPDFLADQVTPNPEKAYFKEVLTGTHGIIAYYNDWMNPPHASTQQLTLGFLKIYSMGAASLPGGFVMHNDQWEDSYFAQVAYQSVRRGNFNSGNCMAAFSGNGVGSCPITAIFLHRHYLGMGANGCMATAGAVYNYSYSLGSLPYQYIMSATTYGQAWTDTYDGDVEGASSSGFPTAGQTPGNTIELQYATNVNTPTGLAVGVGVQIGSGFNPLSYSGFTVADNTIVTSITPTTTNCAVGSYCFIVGLSGVGFSGSGTLPTTMKVNTGGWFGNFGTTPNPLIPAAGCPSEGLISTNTAGFGYVPYYYSGLVAADTVGDSYGTVGRQYFEDFNGNPSPGGVKPGVQYGGSPDCAGSYANWDVKQSWTSEKNWAGFPQWRVWPIGAPQTDAGGRSTGCN